MKRILMVGAAIIFTASTAHAAECSTVTLTSSGSSVSVSRTSSPALCSVTQDGSYASTIQMSVPVNSLRPS